MSPGDEAPSADRSPDVDTDSDGVGASSTADTDEALDGGEPERPREPDAVGPTTKAGGRREVEVPQSLYKVVTVFSTLLAVLFVVIGFSVLDMATTVLSNPPASLFVRLLTLTGLSMETLVAYNSVVALVVALFGLALIAGGAGVYVYGSRFRPPGMGKPKDEGDEGTGDG